MTKQEIIEFADFHDNDKVWIIINREIPEGPMVIRRNIGLAALELLGLAEIAKADVIEQIRGNIHPDMIKRECLEPEK